LPQRKAGKGLDYLCGLAIPEANFADPLTRGQWISRLFGERLNRCVPTLQEADGGFDGDEIFPAANFYTLFRATCEGGVYYEAARVDLDSARTEFSDAQEKFDSWLNARPDLKKESPTRRLSPIKTQNLFPYALAAEFLKRQAELEHIREKIKIFEQRVRLVASFHKKLKRHRDEIEKAVAAYNEKFAHLETVFRPGAADYFRKKFAESSFAGSSKDIGELCNDMTASLRQGEFAKFKTRLNAFVEREILSEPQFALPIAEILREMGEIPASALADWAERCQHVGVRLKSGSARLYTEMNLLVADAATGLEVKKICESRGLGRLNLFADTGASCVAALYHAGAFDADEMFY